MERIIECVPNFSEGRDRAIIDQISGEIGKVAGVMLLDVDPGQDTNRTVVTFAGPPDAVMRQEAHLGERRAAGGLPPAAQFGVRPAIVDWR